MGNFEGGVRVNAFVSGGLIPQDVRGTVITELTAIEDWYTTFCALANVDPTDTIAAAAGLPPVDGLNLWPLLSGANNTSPRTEIWMGSGDPLEGLPIVSGSMHPMYPHMLNSQYPPGTGNTTVIQGLLQPPYKLLIGDVYQAVWTGPLYPNTSSNWVDTPLSCGDPLKTPGAGCLFDVYADPTEHNNIASSNPTIVNAMRQRMQEIQATVFAPNRGSDNGQACVAATSQYKGFWGPFTS